VVTVFSPKGGVGCTTVAVNLAVALQQKGDSDRTDDRRVALVDCNLQFGDVAVMLNVQPTRNITDLLPELEEIDGDMLGSVMTAHGSGLRLLLAPPYPEGVEGMLVGGSSDGGSGGAGLRTVLGLLAKAFDIIVVDLWSWMDDIALTVFDEASLILLVVMPDIPSIKSGRQFLEVARRLNYPVDDIALVVNGVHPSRRITAQQIERAMLPVAAQIPLDDRVALAAANHGTPFVLRDEARPVSQGIAQLAEYVQGRLLEAKEVEEAAVQEEVPATGRIRLGRIFGG
jgi:pilus assembly protein CpaE